MGRNKYAYQGEKEGTAKAISREVRISPKESYEVANAIRNKKLLRAKQFLSNVILLKEAVPYKRHNKDVPHRSEIGGPGRYPRNVSKRVLKLLNEVEANAEALGLNTSLLEISHFAVHRGREIRGGFKGMSQNTPTVHLEIVVKEGKEPVKTEKANGEKKEKAPKTEEKKAPEKKEKPKAEEKTKEEKKEVKTKKSDTQKQDEEKK